MELTQEAVEANKSIKLFEDQYRVAYKTIMELIIGNFESKNFESGFSQSQNLIEQLKIDSD